MTHPQPGLNTSREWVIHIFSGQPVAVLHQHYSEEFLISDIWAVSSLDVPDCVEWELSPDVPCQGVPHFSPEQKERPGTFSFSCNLVCRECKKRQAFIAGTWICLVVGCEVKLSAITLQLTDLKGSLATNRCSLEETICLSQSSVTCLTAGERDPNRKCE